MKIGQIYRDRNFKLMDLFADLMQKVNSASIRNYFNFVANLKRINLEKLNEGIRSIRTKIDENQLPGNSNKAIDVCASFKQIICFIQEVDLNFSYLIQD